MAVALIGAVAGLAGAGANIYSASSASSANKKSLAAEEQRREDLVKEIDLGRDALVGLRENRDVPSDLFGDILARYPGMLNSILPQLTRTSISTTDTLANAGTDQFLGLREKIAPGTGALDSDRLKQINRLNPDNLGREDILAQGRISSQFLPSGTLNPNTGSVAGATTSPVSLYRNLISSQFDRRRDQFLSRSGEFVGQQNSASERQQVSAERFLSDNLDRAFVTATGLTGADIGQQEGDINNQEAWIRLAAAGLAPQYDPSANNALIASGTKGAVDSLSSAAESLARL